MVAMTVNTLAVPTTADAVVKATAAVLQLTDDQILESLRGASEKIPDGFEDAWERALEAHPVLQSFDDAAAAGAQLDERITSLAKKEARRWFRAQSTAGPWSGIALGILGGTLAAARVLPLWSLAATAIIVLLCFVVPSLVRLPAMYRALPWLRRGCIPPAWSVWCTAMESAAADWLTSLPDPGVSAEDIAAIGWART